jgi:Leucine rich repeat
LIFVFAVGGINHVMANQIECEGISDFNWSFLGKIEICWMTDETSIHSQGMKMSGKHSNVQGLSLWGNKKVNYLIDFAGKNLPNLLGYDAGNCAIKRIRRNNFGDLSKLRELLLQDNQLESIGTDTFSDLQALERIHLRKKFDELYC